MAALTEVDVDHRRVVVLAMNSHQHGQMTSVAKSLNPKVSYQLSKAVYTHTDWV